MSAAINPPTPPRLALSIEETCQALGCSHDFWQANIAPSMPVVRLGRRKLVPVRAIEQWLAEHAEAVRP